MPTTPINSGLRDNHTRGAVVDFLKEKIQPGSHLSIVSAYFTIYAYESLFNSLDNIAELEFLFGEPRFISSLDPDKTDKKAFKIEDEGLALSNRLQQKDVARRCAEWIRKKVKIRSVMQTNLLHGKLSDQTLPVDDESRLSLLKVFKDTADRERPLLSNDLEETLNQLIQERRQTERLAALGLLPTRSAIFVGQPGVGKTVTARWLAAQLNVPLYVLDLTAVMSSLLGRSGGNLRAALDFAKRTPCVLLLDEIDAIAKRRSDDSDIGELKRLVTVILQEVDEWPATGLLLAATNHPELIDPALWRRFDLVIEFKSPDMPAVKEAVKRFLGPDYALFGRWIDILSFAFNGESFSDIERDIQRFRRAVALGTTSDADLIEEFVKSRASTLDHPARIDLAVLLAKQTRLSQHSIKDITGVSRDTIRKYASSKSSASKKTAERKPSP